MRIKELSQKTIKDFSEQWLRYRDNEGFYISLELFADIVYPFLKIKAGVKSVIAIEPSDSYYILC